MSEGRSAVSSWEAYCPKNRFDVRLDFGSWEDLGRLEDEATAKGRLREVVGEVKDGVAGEVQRSTSFDTVGAVHCHGYFGGVKRAEVDRFTLGAGLDG